MNIYDLSVQATDNKDVSLADYKGKVMLIVNTATECGFTPQYEPMEAMYEKYHSQGLEIIDIPCNQFAGQSPGTAEEIHEFCTLKFHTKFPQMKKSDVNGENEIPLYTYLKSQKTFEGFGDSEKALSMAARLKTIDADFENNSDIKWNFTKFIVDRTGAVVRRFEPTADMQFVEKYIASLI